MRRSGAGCRALPIVLLCLLSSACGGDSQPPGEGAPSLVGAATGWNVVLISIDTLRADRLGAFGYEARETSPTLDALVTEGFRFDRTSAARATTWPSLASVLTGLYPSGHGVISNGYEFPDEILTLPKMLQASGYQTAAFLSNMCRANHQGWSAFKCTAGDDNQANRRAGEWLGQLDAEKPFFLWVHYFGAHSPYYNGGAVISSLADPAYEGPVVPKKGRLDRIMTESIELSDADLVQLDALYDAAVLGSDRHAAHLLERLAATGRMDRTVIVFLSDHGEDLYDHHGYLYHACSVYQTGLHVPLAFVAPGLLPAGGSTEAAVELIDVAPTIYELVGLPVPAGTHGRSLLPYLERDERVRPQPAFSQYEDTHVRTVMWENWKFVDNPDGLVPVCFGGAPEDLYPLEVEELYDLATDPAELTNLAAGDPERVAELRDLIARRFAGLPDRAEHQELPEDLKEELRALGYLAN